MFESFNSQGDDSMDSRSFGIGLLIGAVVGASAALLLAPDSGAGTRKKLRKGARRLYSQGGGIVEELWDEADRSTRPLRKSAARQIKRGVKQGRRYAEDAADLVEQGRRRFSWR